MARIFISYAREDQAVVRPLAEGLRQASFDVWWDANLTAGDTFSHTIEDQLENSDVILVVWSKRARSSRWVTDEAEFGVQRGVLLPLRIDSARIPLGFGGFNTLDFSTWGGDFGSKQWRKLLDEINRITGAPSSRSMRPHIRVLPQALAVAIGFATVIAGLMWGLYSPASSSVSQASWMGHPIIELFVLAFVATAPIALWSALEVKRAGFESIVLVTRRSFRWFVKGSIIASLILVAAAAAGAIKADTARGIAVELASIFVAATTLSALGMTAFNLLWYGVRRTLGFKAT